MIRTPSARMLVRLLVALFLVSGIVAIEAAPSYAAVGCVGGYCNGQDPNRMNCYPAYNAHEWPQPGGGSVQATIQMRYNADCYALWGRLTRYDCLGGNQKWFVFLQARIPSPYGYVVVQYGTANTQQSCSGGTQYSFMRAIDTANETYRVCWTTVFYYEPDPAPGSTPEYCASDFVSLF